MATIDIVNLVEKNPITKLSATYNNRLLCKIKSNFTNEEQQLFVASFYCYLNCKKDDFVIDLDNVWRWLDFSQKINAKVALERNFTLNQDYKCMTGISVKQGGRGGHNKETILMTLQTFKELCLIAGTEKAKEIRMYFLKLEELLFETIGEECDEIRQQLEDVKETAATQA
jgi:phage anti-repressor protein